MKTLHTILIFTENKPGVLEKIALLIRRKMYNVEQITASETEKKGITRITLSFSSNEIENIPQILTQVNKIVEIINVIDLESKRNIKRELALIKIKRPEDLSNLIALTDIFKGQILNVSANSITVEIIGNSNKIEDFISALDNFEILEIGRSGTVGMEI